VRPSLGRARRRVLLPFGAIRTASRAENVKARANLRQIPPEIANRPAQPTGLQSRQYERLEHDPEKWVPVFG
jgi:hypothetical protein